MNIIEITKQPQEAKQVIRLAAYCRVSSNSKDQLHSFAAQIRYYTEYARKNPQYQLVDIYADEGITGTSLKKRDELNRLLRDCKKGKVDRIIVKTVSRFFRNTEELIITIRMLKDIGVSVYFEEQGIDTYKMNMEMIVTFPGMAAEQESLSISGNMRWSYKKRMESGDFNCCKPAYGFNMIDGQLTVNEDEAIIIRRIFDMYLQGHGKQAIANILNAEGILRNGKGKWYHTAVDYALNNERYMGDALLQKSFTTDTLPFRKIRNCGQQPQYYVENSNPPIISCEIYEAAQNLQKERKPKHNKKKPSYPLTGVLKCPDCGRTFRRQIVSDKVYWICSGKAAGSSDCHNRRIKEEEIYNSFILMLSKLCENRKYLLGTLIGQIEGMQNITSGNQQKIHALDKEIADLSAQNLVITRLHTKGILSAADYSARSSELSNKISVLRIERRKKLSEDEDDELLNSLKTLNEIIEETGFSSEFDGEIFEQIVESIMVIDNANITYNLLGGIELTEQIQEKGRCKMA